MRELKLEDARLDTLAEVMSFVDGVLEETGCSIKSQMRIDVAVEELYVNIAHYAYAPGTGPAIIQMDITQEPKTAVITFIDAGVPHDPLARPDPDITLAAEDRPIGGLGIYMVKKSMDGMEYRYEDGKNILTIRKIL